MLKISSRKIANLRYVRDDLDKLFKKKSFLFSILFTLNFYYFKFSTYESVNFKIKLPELIYFVFSNDYFFNRKNNKKNIKFNLKIFKNFF